MACGRVGVWAFGRDGVWACGRLGVWGWMGRRDRGRLTILVSSTPRFLDSWLRRDLHTTHHRAATRLPTAPRLQRKTPIPPNPHTSHGATPPAHCYPLGSSIPRFTTPADTDTRHKAHAQHRAPKPPYISRSHSASSLLRSSTPRFVDSSFHPPSSFPRPRTSRPNAPPPNPPSPQQQEQRAHGKGTGQTAAE